MNTTITQIIQGTPRSDYSKDSYSYRDSRSHFAFDFGRGLSRMGSFTADNPGICTIPGPADGTTVRAYEVHAPGVSATGQSVHNWGFAKCCVSLFPWIISSIISGSGDV